MLRKLSGNVIVFGSLNALRSLIPIIMLPILTSKLTTDEFGSLSLIETMVLFLMPCIMLGVTSSVSVNYHKYERHEFQDYLTNCFLVVFLSFFVFSVILFLSRDYLINVFDFPEAIIVFLGLFSLLRVYSNTILCIMQTSQDVKSYSLLVLFQTLMDMGFSYLFIVILSQGLNGRLEGVYISLFISSLFGFYYLVKRNLLGNVTFRFSREIIRFGMPLIPHAIGGTIIAMSDRFFITHYFNKAELGTYVVAYQMAAVMLLVGTSINQAWSPLYFNLMKNEKYTQISKFSLLLGGVIILSGISIFLLKDQFFRLLVEKEFWSAKVYYPYMLLGFVFQSLYFIYTNYFFYSGKTKKIALITFLGALINIALNYLLITKFGVIGVAYATAITWCVFLLMVIVISSRDKKGDGCYVASA